MLSATMELNLSNYLNHFSLAHFNKNIVLSKFPTKITTEIST